MARKIRIFTPWFVVGLLGAAVYYLLEHTDGGRLLTYLRHHHWWFWALILQLPFKHSGLIGILVIVLIFFATLGKNLYSQYRQK